MWIMGDLSENSDTNEESLTGCASGQLNEGEEGEIVRPGCKGKGQCKSGVSGGRSVCIQHNKAGRQ